MTPEELERRRRKAAKLFRRSVTQALIARQLGVSRTAVHYWHKEWKARGNTALDKKKVGPKGGLTVAVRKKIIRILERGPEASGYATQLWTLARVGKVITREGHVTYGQTQVWRILRSLGWSCQKPARRAKERDEEAIARWMKVEWPSIQKRGPKTV